MARVKYDVQLSDIADPVKGRAGELYQQAGGFEGKANAIEGQRKADLVSFLGTTGIAAAKGKMESDLDKEVKATLARLDTGPETAQRRQNLINVLDDIASFADNGPAAGSEETKQFEENITRFVRAQQQGTLNREQVIERIAAEVKKASALMPGWAQDFRQIAANRTGISNIDVYGINKLLTTQSAAEKNAAAMQAAQIKYIEDVAKWAGVPPTAVTPELQRAFYEHTQRKNAVEGARLNTDWARLERDDTDRALTTMLMMDIGAGLSTLYTEFQKGIALNAKGDAQSWQESKQWAQQFDGQLSNFLFNAKTQINRALSPQTIRKEDGTTITVPAISPEAAQKLVEQVEKQVTDAKTRLKEAGGLNFYNSLIEVSKGQVELMQNNFLVANQYLSNLRNLGILQGGQLYQAYIVNRKAFEGQHGRQMTEAFDRAFGSPQGAAVAGRTVSGVLDANDAQRNVMRSQDPDGYAVAFQEHKNAFLNAPKNKDVAAVDFTQWSKQGRFVAEASSFTQSNNIREIRQGLDHPAMFSFLKDRSVADKASALMPFVTKLERVVSTATLPTLTEKIAAYNNPSIPANQQGAPGVGVRLNPLTGLLEVYETPGKKPAKEKFRTQRSTEQDPYMASDPAMMGPNYNPALSTSGARMEPRWWQERRQERLEIERSVALLNEQAMLAHSLTKYLGDAPIPVKDVAARMFQMFSTGNKEVRLFEGAAANVPKNETPPAAAPAQPAGNAILQQLRSLGD